MTKKQNLFCMRSPLGRSRFLFANYSHLEISTWPEGAKKVDETIGLLGLQSLGEALHFEWKTIIHRENSAPVQHEGPLVGREIIGPISEVYSDYGEDVAEQGFRLSFKDVAPGMVVETSVRLFSSLEETFQQGKELLLEKFSEQLSGKKKKEITWRIIVDREESKDHFGKIQLSYKAKMRIFI